MRNPYEQEYDDTSCAYCGQPLPADPAPDSWAFHGVCDAQCALLQGLADLGIASGMAAPKGIAPVYRDLILRAAQECVKK